MDSAEILGSLYRGSVSETGELQEDERVAAISLTDLHEAYAVFDRTLTDYPESARDCMRRDLLHSVRRVRKLQRGKGTAPWKASCMHVGIAYDCHLSKLHAKYAGTSKRRRPNCDPTKAALALRKRLDRGQRGHSDVVVPVARTAKRSAIVEADGYAAHSQQTDRAALLVREQRQAAEFEQERLWQLQRQEEERYLRQEEEMHLRQQEEMYLRRRQEEEFFQRVQQEQLFAGHQHQPLHQHHQLEQQRPYLAQQWQDDLCGQRPYSRAANVEAYSPPEPLPSPPPHVYQSQFGHPRSPPGFAHLLRPPAGVAHHMALPVPGVVGGGLPLPDRSWGPGSVYA